MSDFRIVAGALLVFALAVSSLAYGAPMSPAVKAERVVPPASPITGIRALNVEEFGGWEGAELSTRLRKALVDPARLDPTQNAAELLGDIAKLGAELGAEVASNAVGGAVAGSAGAVVGEVADQAVEGAVNAVVDGAFDAMGSDAVRTVGGLRADVYTVGGAQADAVVRGSVSVADKVDKFQSIRPKTDEDGKIILTNGKPEAVQVECSRRTVTLTVDWQVVAAAGGALAQGAAPIVVADTQCGDQQGKLASTDALAKKAMEGAGVATANAFAPHWDTERLEFRRSAALREVMELHRKDQPAQALCAARIAALTEPENHELVLAVGAFTEGLGHVHEALKLYEQAASMDKDKLAAARVSGAKTRLAQLETMRAAYGLTYVPDTQLDTLCPKLPEGRIAVVKRSARLLSGQEAGAASLVAELAKGTKVFIQAEDGGMVEVKLLTGQSGWLPLKELK